MSDLTMNARISSVISSGGDRSESFFMGHSLEFFVFFFQIDEFFFGIDELGPLSDRHLIAGKQAVFPSRADKFAERNSLSLDRSDKALQIDDEFEELLSVLLVQRLAAARGADQKITHPEAEEIFVHLFFRVDVLAGLFARDAIERRPSDVDIAVFDQSRHMAVKKRQEQCADVRTVHVGVSHDDDFVIAELGDVEIIVPDAAAERRDHRAHFGVLQHFLQPRFFDVQNFSADRQNRLESAIAAAFSRASGRIPFHDVDLAKRRIALLAIGQFPGKPGANRAPFF